MKYRRSLLLRLLCFIIAVAQILGISKCCVREEREALLNIKAILNNATVEVKTFTSYLDVYDLSTWDSDPNSDCCSWDGVTCHPSSGRLSMISPQTTDVVVDFAVDFPMDFSWFQNFKDLTTLDISYGFFSTLIHTQVLANLSNLEVLILKHNYLTGPLPSQDLCRLKKIRVLDFSTNLFNGSLPDCFSNLSSLKVLDLSDNNLSGEIPISVIASLTSLEHLSLMYNDFEGLFSLSSLANSSKLKVLKLQMNTGKFQVDTEGEGKGVPWVPLFQLEALHMAECKVNMPKGTFPSFLLYQHDLQYLNLSNNNLVGGFPNWLLVNNTNLTTLILHHNLFIGPFKLPTNIHQPSHALIDLELSNNKMEGELPEDIGQIFSNLEILDVSKNGFNGGIPRSIGNMSKLYALDFSNNNFVGEVPKSLWTSCANLTFLILSHNNLWGQPFPLAVNLSSLIRLSMDNNNLNGTLKLEIWELPSLMIFDIYNNNLWGVVPGFLSNLTSLQLINLSRNNFEGGLPIEFCKLHLFVLHLSHNNLSGSIPACYLNGSLNFLHLQSNSLVGSIPELTKKASDNLLSILDLRDNNLSGGIPDFSDWRESLRALLLGGNHLQGELPNWLCQLGEISFLDLSYNNFTGSIPTCLNFSFGDYNIQEGHFSFISDDYSYLIEDQYVKTVSTNGEEVEFRTKDSLLSFRGNILSFMSGMDLSCNHLTGEIPKKMGSLASLHALNLSHNHLNGSIPKSFHKLQKIESLDLSYNNLIGKIPLQMQNLNSLEVFNVSYNNLSGIVPRGGQFGAFDESSFRGNLYLSYNNSNRGTTTLVSLPPTLSNDGKEDESVIDFTSFIWSFVASYAMVLLILVAVLWINPYWRRVWFYFIETCLYRCFYPYLKDAFY